MSVLKGEGKVPILFGSTSISAASRYLSGYLARPDLAGQWPTVLVVPSAWGVTSSVKDVCRRLARQGFAAAAIDLYRGSPPVSSADREGAEAAASAVPETRALGDLDTLLRFVVNPAATWSSAEHGFGLLGLGSGVPLAARVAVARSAAALALVAGPLAEAAPGLAGFPGGLLGIHGRDDDVVPVDTVVEARGSIPHAEVALYDGVGHDFLDDLRDGYDDGAARDAVERLSVFFAKHLPNPGS